MARKPIADAEIGEFINRAIDQVNRSQAHEIISDGVGIAKAYDYGTANQPDSPVDDLTAELWREEKADWQTVAGSRQSMRELNDRMEWVDRQIHRLNREAKKK